MRFLRNWQKVGGVRDFNSWLLSGGIAIFWGFEVWLAVIGIYAALVAVLAIGFEIVERLQNAASEEP